MADQAKAIHVVTLIAEWCEQADDREMRIGMPKTAELARKAISLLADPWQPIETAPTDGTVVDLWVQRENGKGERLSDMKYLAGNVSEANDWVSVLFEFGVVSDMMLSLEQVTHWMPLPEAPQ